MHLILEETESRRDSFLDGICVREDRLPLFEQSQRVSSPLHVGRCGSRQDPWQRWQANMDSNNEHSISDACLAAHCNIIVSIGAAANVYTLYEQNNAGDLHTARMSASRLAEAVPASFTPRRSPACLPELNPHLSSIVD